MPNRVHFALFLTFLVFGLMQLSLVSTLPTAVALGGAIVAAVEEEEAQNAKREDLRQEEEEEWHFGNLTNTSEFTDFVELRNTSANERIDKNFDDEGRGKHHKKHKMLKHLYPLLIGTVLAKTVLIPLVLKVLTAISTSSFIMAKIALAASGLLALKWILADSGREQTHLEIVHLPPKSGGGNLGYNTIDWSDLSWSGSSYVDVKTTPKQRLKYIPLKSGSGSKGSTGSFSNILSGSYPSNKAAGIANGYRYNFENNLDGKPFL